MDQPLIVSKVRALLLRQATQMLTGERVQAVATRTITRRTSPQARRLHETLPQQAICVPGPSLRQPIHSSADYFDYTDWERNTFDLLLIGESQSAEGLSDLTVYWTTPVRGLEALA